MTFKARHLLAAAALLAAVSGCDTIRRAHKAQRSVAAATNDVSGLIEKAIAEHASGVKQQQ